MGVECTNAVEERTSYLGASMACTGSAENSSEISTKLRAIRAMSEENKMPTAQPAVAEAAAKKKKKKAKKKVRQKPAVPPGSDCDLTFQTGGVAAASPGPAVYVCVCRLCGSCVCTRVCV